MDSKYRIRSYLTEREVLALFWDEAKQDYVFPPREVMEDFIRRYDGTKRKIKITSAKKPALASPL